MLIDTHFHIWQKAQIPWLIDAKERLNKDYHLDDFKAIYEGKLSGAIFIEANAKNAKAETLELIKIQKEQGLILGICTASPECLEFSEVKSIRSVLHVREDEYCKGADFRAILEQASEHKKPFEACLREGVISSFAEVSEGFNERIIINHFCNVTTPNACSDGVKRLAARANSVLKLSCMDSFSKSTPKEFIQALLQMAINLYGEDRLIYGSNYPVSDLKPLEWLAILEGFFSPRVLEKILYKNAKEVYKI